MMRPLALASLAGAVLADWYSNLNYKSPSSGHALGVSIPKVRKRQGGSQYMDAKNLNFTHGVASGDPYAE